MNAGNTLSRKQKNKLLKAADVKQTRYNKGQFDQAHPYWKSGVLAQNKWILPNARLKRGQGAQGPDYWGKGGRTPWDQRGPNKCFWKRSGAKAWRVCTGSSNYPGQYKRKTPIDSGRGRPRKNPLPEQAAAPAQAASPRQNTLPTPSDFRRAAQAIPDMTWISAEQVIPATTSTDQAQPQINLTEFNPNDNESFYDDNINNDDYYDDNVGNAFDVVNVMQDDDMRGTRTAQPKRRKQPKRAVKAPAKGTRSSKRVAQAKKKKAKGGSFLDNIGRTIADAHQLANNPIVRDDAIYHAMNPPPPRPIDYS